MTIILFLLLLSVIICIHEAGHLLFAKLFGVYAYEYSFGMGPALFQKKTKETTYSIRAIPIGGFVALAGESDGDAYPDAVVPEGRRLTDKPAWQRIIILLAGVFMNFLLCLLILSGILLWSGQFAESPEARIVSVTENSPAEKAGLQADDLIIGLKEGPRSMKPKNFQDLQTFFMLVEEEDVEITVLRGEEELTLTVHPEYSEEYRQYMIGITGPGMVIREVNLFNCLYYGFKEMIYLFTVMVESIRTLFFGRNLDQLSGPVGIYTATEESVSYGLAGYLVLMAELSLNVGLLNLLPLPVLDGGQVVITIFEALFRRKLNDKVKIGLMAACWVLLIMLMLFVTWNDISRLMG